jgi:hypothetical protein
LKVFNDNSPYEKESTDKIRQLWAQFFLQMVEEEKQEHQTNEEKTTKHERLKKTYM